MGLNKNWAKIQAIRSLTLHLDRTMSASTSKPSASEKTLHIEGPNHTLTMMRRGSDKRIAVKGENSVGNRRGPSFDIGALLSDYPAYPRHLHRLRNTKQRQQRRRHVGKDTIV